MTRKKLAIIISSVVIYGLYAVFTGGAIFYNYRICRIGGHNTYLEISRVKKETVNLRTYPRKADIFSDDQDRLAYLKNTKTGRKNSEEATS